MRVRVAQFLEIIEVYVRVSIALCLVYGDLKQLFDVDAAMGKYSYLPSNKLFHFY